MSDKQELKKKYRLNQPPMGIFQIKNLQSGKILIGRATNLPGIINSNKFQLKNGLHTNKELQSDYTRLGDAQFSFDILDTLEPKEDSTHDDATDLKELEQIWLDKLQPFLDQGYHKKPK